jgi:hypothetical protein
MPRKKRDEFEIYADEYGEEELETLLELLDDFPELGEYLEDVLELDDEDFYSSDYS